MNSKACVKNKVIGQTCVGLRIGNQVKTIMGFQYWASTQLRYQSFDNRLEDEPRVRTLICRRLYLSSVRLKASQEWIHCFFSLPQISILLILFRLIFFQILKKIKTCFFSFSLFRLATLLEGAGCIFFKLNFKVNYFIILWWKKCVKLVWKWIIVI